MWDASKRNTPFCSCKYFGKILNFGYLDKVCNLQIPILILKIHAEIAEIAWYCDITKMTCYDLTTLKLDTLNEGHFLLQIFLNLSAVYSES